MNAASEGAFPLTEAQKEIWLPRKWRRRRSCLQRILKLEFRGDFDVDSSARPHGQVVERHPILLASISADGQSQKFQSISNLDIPLMDLIASRKLNRDSIGRGHSREVSGKFDLTNWPAAARENPPAVVWCHVVVWTAITSSATAGQVP